MFFVYSKLTGRVVGYHDTYEEAWEAANKLRRGCYAVGFDKATQDVWSQYGFV